MSLLKGKFIFRIFFWGQGALEQRIQVYPERWKRPGAPAGQKHSRQIQDEQLEVSKGPQLPGRFLEEAQL